MNEFYHLDNPSLNTKVTKRTIPNRYELDVSTRLRTWIVGKLHKYNIVVPVEEETITNELVFKTIRFDKEDAVKVIWHHINSVEAFHNCRIERIIVGRDVYGEFIKETIKNPFYFQAQMPMHMLGKPKHIMFEGVLVQLVPWFTGVVVIPRLDR